MQLSVGPQFADWLWCGAEAEIRRHVARGAEFFHKRHYAEAEQEYRVALLFDPQNSDLYDSLAIVLIAQEK